MWRLLVPLVVCIGILLTFSMLAAVLGAVGVLWPWLLIGLGMWLFWHEDGRHQRRQRREQRTAQRTARPPTPPTQTRADEPVPIRPPGERELPAELQSKVDEIRRKAEVLLAHADRFPPFSQDLYLVRQTVSDYLPRTIAAFLRLPTAAADQPLVPSGKTPRQELDAQLSLLSSKLDEIARDLHSDDVNQLLANRRFLEERFAGRKAAGA
jgi:hypothetical protein